MEDQPGAKISVSFRLQRIRTEYAYVGVPVTADMIIENEDGTGHLDTAKLRERAIELGQSSEVIWYPEGQQIDMHPVQKAPEPDEPRFSPRG